MKQTIWITTLAIVSAAAVVVGVSAGADAPALASAKDASALKIAHCLIGTWHDRKLDQVVLYQNHLVDLAGNGGDSDHIHANGVDRDDWLASHPLKGQLAGSPIHEVVRGVNRTRLTTGDAPKSLEVDELGWSSNNTATFTYEGETSTQTNQEVGVGSAYYRCTATRLTWLAPTGTVVGKEKRISRTP